ncbi:DUF4242 domain-containing protein [Salicibibacter halophilus]|uniref:DUF4242 domain-containing protein n=1 Tax=Salicibibacter halophilus TaxID=2502791 RepID=A0A514LJK4_9BACI|nr:DUF4242 domain-containing protein [Salicibibacter halophilus]QDI92034.1 DUF4242 domain-containing protein [Salicibibacter halophilus]
MGLFLLESTIDNDNRSKTAFDEKVATLEKSLEQSELIEVQVSSDFDKAFFIVESDNEDTAKEALENQNISVSLVKEVRIVGQDLEDAKKEKGKVNYLVEWNFPEDLTMDAYLERKKKNSVHYAEVPEVDFARTYVCEDMTKCLCFYDAPDEDAVKRAREAVKTPLDSITEISHD